MTVTSKIRIFDRQDHGSILTDIAQCFGRVRYREVQWGTVSEVDQITELQKKISEFHIHCFLKKFL